MKKTREQKGITLVALIITILALVILASITIASIQNWGLIQKALDGREKWKKAQEKEQGILANTDIPGYDEIVEGELDVIESLKAPTAIEWVSISGNNLTVKATGGDGIGYQYSVDGNTWSGKVSNENSYTFQNLLANGTNWTIYARTISEDGASATNVQQKIISFNYYPWMVQGKFKYYVPEGSTWTQFIEKYYTKQRGNSNVYFRIENFDWIDNSGLGDIVVETGNRVLFGNQYLAPSVIIQENENYVASTES